jgi:hypothetical protein
MNFLTIRVGARDFETCKRAFAPDFRIVTSDGEVHDLAETMRRPHLLTHIPGPGSLSATRHISGRALRICLIAQSQGLAFSTVNSWPQPMMFPLRNLPWLSI